MYLATLAGGDTRIIRADGVPATEIGVSRLAEAVSRAAGLEERADLQVLEHTDWFYRDRRRERPLPVVLVRLRDKSPSRYYLDPKTGRIVGSYDQQDQFNRWAYHALHSLDFPWLYSHRPAWDIVVIMFMLGGSALSITSVILGWRVLTRTIGRPRA